MNVKCIQLICVKVTLFAPEWTRVTAYLDTVDLPSLDPTSTQTGLVSSPPVLLAQQHVHSALRPFCWPPVVTEKERIQNWQFRCFHSFLLFSKIQNSGIKIFRFLDNWKRWCCYETEISCSNSVTSLKCQICLPVHTWCRGSFHLPGGCRTLSPPAEDRLSHHLLGTGWPSCCECAVLWARWGHSSTWSRRPIRTTHSGHSL